jgi:hypothetical protein
MLTEYIFEHTKGNTVKVYNVIATSEEEAEKKLRSSCGEDAALELITTKEIDY